PLCVDAMEVTVERFGRCVAAGRCAAPDQGGACNWRAQGREEHPINCVRQSEAAAYCEWAGARLPTVIEGEWAARGAGAGTDYRWGNDSPDNRVCWSLPSPRHGTCPAGAFPPGDSPQGVSDLVGNVFEWTSTPAERGTGTYRIGGGDFGSSDKA